VPVEIEIWPSATLFETGSSLLLTVQGHDAAKYPAFRHTNLANHGSHTIFTGGRFDSCLTIPLNRNT
jgi:predicted acyl esterase